MDIFSLFTTIILYCSNPGLCTIVINPEDNDKIRIEMCIDENIGKIQVGIVDFNNSKNKKIITIIAKKCIEA